MDEKDRIIQAGRMQNDINLDDLTNIYKRKIFDAISYLNFKINVFDFDGTLTNFRYTNDTLLPCKDYELQSYCREHNLYENAEALKTMQYIINELDPNNIYVLTSTVPSLRENKNRFIYSNFPTIKKENIIHTNGADEKLEILKKIYEERQKQIIFVEDLYKTLLNAEEKYDFVRSLHISNLIP